MNKVRFVTYNVDGLPDTLNLGDLPWCLKPISWVYKLFKHTTEVRINDGSNRAENMQEISKYLKSLNADIIAVQEDFNYHKELMSALKGYRGTTHTGDISLDHLFSKTEWRPLPRFTADGLNLFTKGISINCEHIERWKKSNGYISHANDKLTHKGFRYYCMTVKGVNINLYVIHMDADFYDPVSCPNVSKDAKARKSQIEQLLTHINNLKNNNPVIILGDTNSVDKYSWDKDNIDILRKAGFIEAEADEQDVDRLFYRGDIKVKKAYYDAEKQLSDHKPFIVDIEL